MNSQDADNLLRVSQAEARRMAGIARVVVAQDIDGSRSLYMALKSGIEWDAVHETDRDFVITLAALKILELINDIATEELRAMAGDN